jgi:hypothetical protein
MYMYTPTGIDKLLSNLKPHKAARPDNTMPEGTPHIAYTLPAMSCVPFSSAPYKQVRCQMIGVVLM